MSCLRSRLRFLRILRQHFGSIAACFEPGDGYGTGRSMKRRLTRRLYPEMFKLYGNSQLPELDAWIGLMRSAGFRNVRPWKPDAASLIPADSDGEFLYDPYQLFDLETLQDPDTLGFFAQNHAFLLEFHEHLSFCVFMGEK